MRVFLFWTLALFVPSALADFDGPYALTPPNPAVYTVPAGGGGSLGQLNASALARFLIIDTTGSPSTLVLDTEAATRPVGGYATFLAHASGLVRFAYTVEGEGAGSFSWGLGDAAEGWAVGIVTNLVTEPTQASFHVRAGDHLGFRVISTGEDFITSVELARRRVTITQFEAPLSNALPRLTITPSPPHVIMAWPVSYGTAFHLESCNSFEPGSAGWKSVESTAETVGEEFQIKKLISKANQYFRLRSE